MIRTITQQNLLHEVIDEVIRNIILSRKYYKRGLYTKLNLILYYII